MSYNVKKLPKIICLELGRGWLKSLLYLFPSLSCHPSLATQTWGCLCCPRVVLRREKDVPVCHLMPLEERLPVLRTGMIVSEPHFVNWMPVLPDELFSHRGPGLTVPQPGLPLEAAALRLPPSPLPAAPSPAAAPASPSPASLGLGTRKSVSSDRKSCSGLGCGCWPCFLGSALPPLASVGRERVADPFVACCLLLPLGWGSGLRLAWANLQVSLWGHGD